MEKNDNIIDFNKVVENKKLNEFKDLMDWDWKDFKVAWEAIRGMHGEDTAWEAIYDMFELRSKG